MHNLANEISVQRDELLKVCKEAYQLLDNIYDVDEPHPGHYKEVPFSGAGHLINRLSTVISKVEGR